MNAQASNEARVDFTSKIANARRTLQGEAKAVLVLRGNDEGIRIVGEKEQ
ncbi:MAG: hypothetical protein AABZ10_05545 [Nitrospirota bacterium]